MSKVKKLVSACERLGIEVNFVHRVPGRRASRGGVSVHGTLSGMRLEVEWSPRAERVAVSTWGMTWSKSAAGTVERDADLALAIRRVCADLAAKMELDMPSSSAFTRALAHLADDDG